MQHNTHLSSPTVRVHQSSPTPHQQQHKSMLAPSSLVGGGYDGFQSQYLSAVPRGFQGSHHKRGSSGSSIASGGPPSPLSQSTINPRIATSDTTFSPSTYDIDFGQQVGASAKSMHIPDSMIYQPNGFGVVDMRRIHSTGNDDRASYAGAQSVSSMSHNSPPTPHTNYDNEYDEKVFQGHPSVAYQQSLQDVFPDQSSFSPHAYQQMQQRLNVQRANMMQDRLQAAQQDHLRTQSPLNREKSPFKQSSEYMPAPTQRPQPPQQRVPQLQKQRTSISPKELMLDEHDIDEPNYSQPMFPDASQFNNRRSKSNLSSTYTFDQQPMIPQHYPFVSQQSRQDLNETPDFPAPLLSMESTNEEGPSEPSSQQSVQQSLQQSIQSIQPQAMKKKQSLARPVDTSSDAGTFSCTYHGCSQRFPTAAKLQKHKREGHRQHSPSITAAQLARNSQAGPHKCERINPSTGKPCNSIFSRPYDLTRHEDTIHNSLKKKVRCHLCTEEKTFSRNDALTRHMRVVHPDVDWVGKQKRKSKRVL